MTETLISRYQDIFVTPVPQVKGRHPLLRVPSSAPRLSAECMWAAIPIQIALALASAPAWCLKSCAFLALGLYCVCDVVARWIVAPCSVCYTPAVYCALVVKLWSVPAVHSAYVALNGPRSPRGETMALSLCLFGSASRGVRLAVSFFECSPLFFLFRASHSRPFSYSPTQRDCQPTT